MEVVEEGNRDEIGCDRELEDAVLGIPPPIRVLGRGRDRGVRTQVVEAKSFEDEADADVDNEGPGEDAYIAFLPNPDAYLNPSPSTELPLLPLSELARDSRVLVLE